MTEISDDALASVMAGALGAMVQMESFPVELDPATPPYQVGREAAFVLTTRSGLQYRVTVELIGQL